MSAPPGTSADRPVPRVIPAPGTRLEQLLAMREDAKAQLAAAKERLDLINAGITADTAALHPGRPVIDIAGSAHWPALRLRWHEGAWYVPVATLRTKYRAVYDELRQRGKDYWQLHPVDGSEP